MSHWADEYDAIVWYPIAAFAVISVVLALLGRKWVPGAAADLGLATRPAYVLLSRWRRTRRESAGF